MIGGRLNATTFFREGAEKSARGWEGRFFYAFVQPLIFPSRNHVRKAVLKHRTSAFAKAMADKPCAGARIEGSKTSARRGSSTGNF
jgi:hypothetical protein